MKTNASLFKFSTSSWSSCSHSFTQKYSIQFDPYLHRLEILIKLIAKIFEEHKLCNFGIYGLLCFQTVWNNPLPCIHMELYGTMLSFVFIVYWYNRVCQCDLSLIFQLTLKTDDSFVLDTMSSSNNFINAPFPSI